MSLITDALRKARREAAQRGTPRPWLPAAPPGGGPPRPTPLGLSLLLGTAIAVAAGAAGAWLAVRLVSPARPEATTQVTPVPPTPPPQATRGPLAPPAPRDPHPLAVAEVSPLPLATPSPRAEAPPASEAGATPTASPPPPPPPTAEPQERVFVLHADLGYATLHLDFIVYKPSAPFGRINGQDIVPGSIVDGFRVDEIGADYVRLSDRRGPLVLRVR